MHWPTFRALSLMCIKSAQFDFDQCADDWADRYALSSTAKTLCHNLWLLLSIWKDL